MQFEGKKGLIIGVANDRSIAWAIAQQILNNGGRCGFTHLPDRADDEKQKNRRRVSKLTDQFDNAEFLLPMDANNDDDIRSVFEHTEKTFGKIDFLLHSIAFADREDLGRQTMHTSRNGFKIAMEASVYSLMAITSAAENVMNPGGSILTMTYYGGEKCVPGYNVMGVCKAALDAAMRYLAFDMGAHGVRVNALSAGPVQTLAGRAAGVERMLKMYEHMAPLGRNVTHEEVGKTGAFLLSDASNGVSGEILHVDGGYHAMGSPGRLLDEIEKSQKS
ncbi:Enoyl-[acyl-carrier-protein] reductase [NADH] [Neorhodopirellula lusitana]|uniref:Enoyl-[acyl-carrier-protein] reductase [NADH] n=1 Tax=Neorhodopirellula lusitana TaxID=445327 RepID=A0ABY1PUC0_9BACT|nr:enoyl-ACP reductase [Neorhodopirellula lusitana]SMP48394.1 Enoyl-[acyl-carrier-protein] reductase [NADH] [Neorhodopirellula lusitana]